MTESHSMIDSTASMQEKLYGTLEKSSGCCLVRHNEVLALKAEARWRKKNMRVLSGFHSKSNINNIQTLKTPFFSGYDIVYSS